MGPEEKLTRLADEIANKNGEISMANTMILLYLFCGGKTEDNLAGIFNLFDADGNKHICLKELYEVMSVFIEIAEGKRIMWTWPQPWLKYSRKQMEIRMKLWTSMSSRTE